MHRRWMPAGLCPGRSRVLPQTWLESGQDVRTRERRALPSETECWSQKVGTHRRGVRPPLPLAVSPSDLRPPSPSISLSLSNTSSDITDYDYDYDYDYD
jgi:hypothetical protein